MQKYCPKCKETKSVNNFGLSKKDGYQCYCKQCKSLYQKLNKDKKLQWQASYRNKNRNELNEKRKEYYYYNAEKEKISKKKWIENNRHKIRAKGARRRARLLQAIPCWANLEEITEFYKNCPEGYHVDHIIPLQGKNVCGLHVIENLQYLPAIENLRKGNKYEQEC